MICKIVYFFISMCFLLFSLGCDKDRDLEDYGDLSSSPEGIIISGASEHKGGYKRRDCLVCHNVANNVHRSESSVVDADEIVRLTLLNGGSAYCMSCHGDNGVEP